MFDLHALLPFLLALQLSPRPDMLLVTGRGIGQGRRVAFLTVLGATVLAGLVQLPLLAFGIVSLLQGALVAFDILRWGGAVYLAWIGLKLLVQSRSAAAPVAEACPVSNRTAIMQGMVSNLTNPKVLAFMLAFLPRFVDPRSGWSVASQLLVLGAIQKLSRFVVLGSVALGAGSLRGWLSRRPHWIAWQKRFTGVVLIGLGIRLAFGGDARSVVGKDWGTSAFASSIRSPSSATTTRIASTESRVFTRTSSMCP